MINDIKYAVKKGLVYIQEGLREPYALDEKNVLAAIENVKRSRNDYETQEAYDYQLAKYQNALGYLRVHKIE